MDLVVAAMFRLDAKLVFQQAQQQVLVVGPQNAAHLELAQGGVEHELGAAMAVEYRYDLGEGGPGKLDSRNAPGKPVAQ